MGGSRHGMAPYGTGFDVKSATQVAAYRTVNRAVPDPVWKNLKMQSQWQSVRAHAQVHYRCLFGKQLN